MKQRELVRELYQACFSHNEEKIENSDNVSSARFSSVGQKANLLTHVGH